MTESRTKLRYRILRHMIRTLQSVLPVEPPSPPSLSPAALLERQLMALSNAPRGVRGSTEILGWMIEYADAPTLCAGIRNQVLDGVNDFRAASEAPRIIDCGANIGISVLRFKQLYPKARITAFEPDPVACAALRRNTSQNGFPDVTVIEAAVWDCEGVMRFHTDGADGGHLLPNEDSLGNDGPLRVRTVRLADYLQEPVDFVKLDVEGAELVVLQDCARHLENVACLAVEVHYRVSRPGDLAELLCILGQTGFKVSLATPFSGAEPRIDLRTAYIEKPGQNADIYVILYAWR